MPRPELPSWLYEQPRELSTPGSSTTALTTSDSVVAWPQSRYLKGINGVLPSADYWLSTASSRAEDSPLPASSAMPEPQPGRRRGCGPLAALIVFGMVAVLGALAWQMPW